MSAPAAGSVADLCRQAHESVGDIGSARSLPAGVYTSPEFYEFEKNSVFRSSWLYLCHESQVPEPGDHLAVTVADEPLLVARDHDGRINVLSAVCQHRGYVITDCDGSSKRFRCPYHAWTYELDGRLVAAPSMGPAHDLDELRRTIALPKLRVEIWHGLVFATLDADAAPLAPTVADADAAIAPYRLGDMVVAETVTIRDLPFNWKNMQENALEEYHTSYIHKGFHENVPADRVVHGAFPPGAGAVYRHAGMIIGGGEPVPGRPTLPVVEGLTEQERHHFVFLAVPPLLFAAIRPDGAKVFRIVPQSAGLTTLTIQFLFPRPTLELDDFDDLLRQQVAMIDTIDQPDLDSNARVYAGLRSSFAPRGQLSPQESSLPQFNRWLLDRYEGAGRPAAGVSA
ncbi:MAG: aromatic ring-hydroxylating dioxygenase subunit alpha [Actinomycetota bacterium]|nr:aromatic ring-hydroxylating dioxygenase subunit alpha [Actinomycetota bacterium]